MGGRFGHRGLGRLLRCLGGAAALGVVGPMVGAGLGGGPAGAVLPSGGLGPFAPGARGALRAQALSRNWAGFIDGATACPASSGICPSGQAFTGSSSTFVVPALPVPQGTGFLASWAGIGGVFGSGLVQIGTIEQVSGQRTVVVGFWEDYPNPPTYFGLGEVSPGDTVSVTVGEAANTFELGFSDATSGFSTTVDPEAVLGSSFVSPDPETAEWILEDPSCGSGGRLCPFADFSPATVTTEAASFTGQASSPLESILVNAAGEPEVAISPSSLPSGLATAFTVSRLLPGQSGPGHNRGGPVGPQPGQGPPPPGQGHGSGSPGPGAQGPRPPGAAQGRD